MKLFKDSKRWEIAKDEAIMKRIKKDHPKIFEEANKNVPIQINFEDKITHHPQTESGKTIPLRPQEIPILGNLERAINVFGDKEPCSIALTEGVLYDKKTDTYRFQKRNFAMTHQKRIYPQNGGEDLELFVFLFYFSPQCIDGPKEKIVEANRQKVFFYSEEKEAHIITEKEKNRAKLTLLLLDEGTTSNEIIQTLAGAFPGVESESNSVQAIRTQLFNKAIGNTEAAEKMISLISDLKKEQKGKSTETEINAVKQLRTAIKKKMIVVEQNKTFLKVENETVELLDTNIDLLLDTAEKQLLDAINANPTAQAVLEKVK